ncbi:beta-glucoside-specific PTS transporter subunit IIABC [Paenibacillus massiliensis]|uniref:beta-glucoside-specific PTS transporter subunit IIABC n=1 Tax=Paenibacillus massiliensis TaxID=225917 RepID=UPI00035CD3A4|nr:beta-glucoside-specific PTS transporter subunit IIABC [Paenibacillus massiliensis]
MNYEKTAQEILKSVGGAGNVNSVMHCMTRLRFKLKDSSLPNKEQVKQIDGVMTVVDSGGQFQVVIGNDVPKVYAELTKLPGISAEAAPVEKDTQGSLFSRFVDVISGVFMPVVGVLSAVGILKGLLSLFVTLNWLSDDMGTYKILFAAADALFYFFPIFLGFSAAKKFGGNPYISAVIGAALVYPTMTAAFAESTPLSFMTIPVVLISYTSSVIPIILGSYLAAIVEKFFSKVLPSAVKLFFVPLLTILIVLPLVFLAIGPIATFVSNQLAAGTLWVYGLSPIIAGLLLAGFWQTVIIFGLHWAFIPILLNNVMNNGFDPINGMLFCTIFAQTGAAFAISLKTKDTRLKPIATSATIAGIMGVTEPAIYGVTLPLKKPFILASIAAGIAGAIAGMFGAKNYYTIAGGGIFGIPMFIGPEGMDQGFVGFLISVVVAFIGGFVLTYLFGYKNQPVTQAATEAQPTESQAKDIQATDLSTRNVGDQPQEVSIFSPLEGEWLPLSEVGDEAFSSGAMGKGAAILPTVGVVYAPFSGTVQTLFKTRHAIGLVSPEGVETLIHIGINTVKLKGEHFTTFVKEGDIVQKGDKLVEFDIEAIRNAGYDTTTSVIVSSLATYTEISIKEHGYIRSGEPLFNLK